MKGNNYRSIYKRVLYCSAALLAFAPAMQVGAEDETNVTDYELVNEKETGLHSLSSFIAEDDQLNPKSTLFDLVQRLSSLHKEDITTEMSSNIELIEAFIFEHYTANVNIQDLLVNADPDEEIVDGFDEEQTRILNSIVLEDMMIALEKSIAEVALEGEAVETSDQKDDSSVEDVPADETETAEDKVASDQNVSNLNESSDSEEVSSDLETAEVSVEEEIVDGQEPAETESVVDEELTDTSEDPVVEENTQADLTVSSKQVSISSSDESERNEMYLASVNAGSASDAWLKAIDGYTAFPEDGRFKEALELAAGRNTSYAEYLESREKYESARWYFNRVLRGPWISEKTEKFVNEALVRITGKMSEVRREEMYQASVNAGSASDAWLKAIDGYTAFPEDDRFKEALELAAARNIDYAETLEKREKYENAQWYFNRVLRGPWISETTETYVREALDRINEDVDEARRESMYQASVNAKSASDAWLKAIDGYTAYSEDDRFKEALELAGARNIGYAEYLESREKYESAQWYFNRVLRGPWISETTETYVREAMARISADVDEARRESMYQSSVNAGSASDAWLKAIDGYTVYPEDDRFKEALELAAARNIDYAETLEKREKYESAQWYFNRVLRGPWISETTETYVREAMARISADVDEARRESMYQSSVNAGSASDAWLKAIDGYTAYPEDNRFKEALELAAARNIDYAETLEKREKYETAQWYFNRVLRGPWISEKTGGYVTDALTRINGKIEEMKREAMYQASVNEEDTIKAWDKALEGYTAYPDDARFKDAIDLASSRMISYAEGLKNQGEAENAENHLYHILQGPWVSEETRTSVKETLKWVNGPKDEAIRKELYQASVNGTNGSEAWLKAIDGFKKYPDDDRFKEAIELAAARNISYAETLESRGNLESALWYFNRVLKGPWLSEETLAYVTEKADGIKTIIDTEFIYEKALNTESLTERWSLSVEGHMNHKSDSRLEKLVQDTAVTLLNEAFKEHKNQNYSAAATLYELLVEGPEIVSTQTAIARNYVILADKQVTIDKASYHLSLYNHTLSEALDEQMRYSPKSDGAGKVLATREQTEYYLNPKNFVSLNGVDNEYTQLNGRVDASALNVRSGIGTEHSIITTVIRDTEVKIVNYEDGWYNVHIAIGDRIVEGWVTSTYIKVESRDSESRELFEAFYPVATVTADSLNVRQGPGVTHTRIMSVSKNRTYRILDQQNGWYNIQVSSSVSGWVSGDFVTVSKNINRSALQFLKLSGSSGISAEDLNEELSGKGILDGTGESFRQASQLHNINEVYLMAHAEHESGNGTSRLSTGVLVSEVDGVAVEPRTVYNMYGIYAFDDSALKSGSEYAYKKGWFTPEEAIIGGAEWISSRYINHETHQQDTLYKMRWNPAKPGVHQYATHIAWSQIQTSTLNTFVELSQKYDLNMHFDIPKYN